MDHIEKLYQKDFTETFRLPLNFLLQSNVRFFDDNLSRVRKYWRFFYIVPSCLTVVFSTIFYFINLIRKEGDIFEIAICLSVILIEIQGIFKGFVLLPNKAKICQIITDLGELWPKDEKLNEKQLIEKNNLVWKLQVFQKVYSQTTNIGAYLYMLSSITETAYGIFILGNKDTKKVFPFQCIYPYVPDENWIVYLATYLVMCWSMWKIVNVLAAVELLMVTLTAHLSTVFYILSEDLLSIVPTKSKSTKLTQEFADAPSDSIKMTLEFVDKTSEMTQKHNETDHSSKNYKNNLEISCFELGNIIRRHQQLIELAKAIDDIFNKIIFFNLLFASITICVFGIVAKFSNGSADIARNFVGSICLIIPVYIICYYGQLLSDSSLRIADSAFNNIWYKGSLKYQRIILFIILRSQKQCCLTSLKYAPITLNTFTKVMSTTWSYFSLATRLYEDN